jgi:hypothetical protein
MFEFGGYTTDGLDEALIQERYHAAMRDGRLRPGDHQYAERPFLSFLRSRGSNMQHVFGADSSTSATKTRANIEGRRSALRLLRFIRTLPGCENARLVRMPAETAVRETYRIVGEAIITRDDYVAARAFPDAVCHSFYPIDLHDERGVAPEPLRPGRVPTVPLGALVPRGRRHLLVAGRSVSSDRLANSALRVQASCMAMGQAAGSAAALAARSGTTPGEVPLDVLRQALREHGAIVPA